MPARDGNAVKQPNGVRAVLAATAFCAGCTPSPRPEVDATAKAPASAPVTKPRPVASVMSAEPESRALPQKTKLERLAECLPAPGNGWKVEVTRVRPSPIPGMSLGYTTPLLDSCDSTESVNVAEREVAVSWTDTPEGELLRLHRCSSPLDVAHMERPHKVALPLNGWQRSPERVSAYLLSDGVHFDWVVQDRYVFEMQATFDGLDDADPKKRRWHSAWVDRALDALRQCEQKLSASPAE